MKESGTSIDVVSLWLNRFGHSDLRSSISGAAGHLDFRPRLAIALLSVTLYGTAAAQPPADVYQADPAQQLALQQLDQLIAAEQTDAAVGLAARLIDEAGGRLLPTDGGIDDALPEGSIVQRFVPLEQVVHDLLLRAGVTHPATLHAYRRAYDDAAAAALERAAEQRSIELADEVVRRYFATSSGDDALLLLADLAIDHGWLTTAAAALRRIDPLWQPHPLPAEDSAARVDAVDWALLLSQLGDVQQRLAVARAMRSGPRGLPLGSYLGSELPQAQTGARLVYVYLLAGDRQRAQQFSEVLRVLFPDDQVTIAGRSGSVGEMTDWLLKQANDWTPQTPGVDQWWTLGGDATRAARARPLVGLEDAPRWTHAMQRLPEVNPETLSPIARRRGAAVAAATVPVISGDHVFVHTGTGVAAWHLHHGDPWPPGSDDGPFFTAGLTPDEVVPANVPVDAAPRYTLTVADDRLAGRFGFAVTGPTAVLRRSPRSQLAVLDLESEGRLQNGYPLTTSGRTEFEGAPLVIGSRMYVGVTSRDDAAIQSRVVCFDVASGQSIWGTPAVAQLRSAAAAEVARVTHAVVSFKEGVVYYQAGLGGVAAIDAFTGRLRWAVRYRRQELAAGDFPRPRAAEGKRLSPVALVGGCAVIAADDLDRVLALDAMDGRLLWATPAGVADDVDQVLGVTDGQLVMGGIRLYWVDAGSGRLLAAFPAGTSQQPGGAVPLPAGSGRGLIAGRRVYWPTRETIFVFDATVADAGPPLAGPRGVDTIALKPLGLVGGHLAAAPGALVNVGQGVVSMFAAKR